MEMAESRPSQLFKLLEEAEAAGDDDKVKEIKSDLFREFGIKLAKGGRVKLEDGTTITPMGKPEQTEENTIIPMDTFESKINNAVMGIRGGIDKDLMVEMLENQRVELGIPEDDAKMAVQNFMLRFQRGIK
jgi:hypothetical protein